jgi:hypothetical protein
MSYMVYPYYLPSERMTMVVMLNSGAEVPGSWRMMQDIARIISPNNVWPGLPKEVKEAAGTVPEPTEAPRLARSSRASG